MIIRHFLLLWTISTLSTSVLWGQKPDSLLRRHRNLLAADAHRVIRPHQIGHFLQELARLQSGQNREVVIAHVGDSHIQADYLPRTLRRSFWQQFGCAGRGMVFPYAMAETHGPLDYQWTSPDLWTHRRRTFQRGGPDIGVTGMGLRGKDTSVVLDFAFAKNQDIPFDYLTVLGDARTQWRIQIVDPVRPPGLPARWQYHTVRAGETLYGIGRQYGQPVQQLLSWNHLPGPFIHPGQQLRVDQRQSTIAASDPLLPTDTSIAGVSYRQLPQPATRLRLFGESRALPELYGVVLHNRQQAGILYHMLGTNGTTYYHYHRSERFWRQMHILQPDLIIVTLGTNEALQQRFLPRQIEPEVRGFLRKLKALAPGGRILLMTNPDAGHQDGRIRQNPRQMRDLLLRVAAEEDVAVYDLYTAMGGAGSIYRWREAQLAYRDFVHFTKKGYIFQGALVYEALMQAYYRHD